MLDNNKIAEDILNDATYVKVVGVVANAAIAYTAYRLVRGFIRVAKK